MTPLTADMVTLDERDREVLDVLADGRANPYLIREETGLDKGDTNTVLNRLARAGLLKQVTRGLYEITPEGRDQLDTETTLDAVRGDLERGLEHHDWGAVEDALARIENDAE